MGPRGSRPHHLALQCLGSSGSGRCRPDPPFGLDRFIALALSDMTLSRAPETNKGATEMIHNIKALSLAIVAVAAMSVVAASAAQASELHATVPNKANVTGEQSVSLKPQYTKSGSISQCTQAIFEGTITNKGQSQQQTTEQELTVTPTYSGCKTVGINSQVLMNGCKYTITGSHTPQGGQAQTTALTAWLDITGCTAGKSIETKLSGCTITVPEQTTLSHLKFTNIAEVQHQPSGQTTPHHVEVQFNIQGITYEYHGIACPKPLDGQPVLITKLTHDGDLTGNATFKAYEDSSTAQVTKHGHQYTEHKCGNQVGLLAT